MTIRSIGLSCFAVLASVAGVLSFFFPTTTVLFRIECAIAGSLIFIAFVVVAKFRLYGLRDWWNADADVDANTEVFTIQHDPAPGIVRRTDTFVQRAFGHGRINHREYDDWRAKNKYVLSCVLDGRGLLTGFFDVFPLNRWAGEGLILGRLRETDLTIDDIASSEYDTSSDVIYIATVYCKVETERDRFVARHRVMLALFSFLASRYPPRKGRVYAAFAYSSEGRRALERNNFRLEVGKEEHKERADLYVLDAESAQQGMERFSIFARALAQAFSQPSVRNPDSHSTELET